VNKQGIGPVIRSAVQYVALAALTAGCVTEAKQEEISLGETNQELARQSGEDSRYMRQVFQGSQRAAGIQGRIDLADPGQYRFVKNRLSAAGKTPQNSPELFTRLERSKQKAVAAKTSLAADTMTSATDFCAGYILLGQESKSGTSSILFSGTRPVVSCPGGSSYLYVDVYTFNMNLAGTEFIFVAGAEAEDFTGQPVFDDMAINAVLPATLGRVNYTDSYAITYNAAGVEQYTYFAVESGIVPVPPAPAAINLQHPRIHPWIANGGSIEMCELRGHPTQCDYAVGNLTNGAFTGWATNAAGIYTGIAGVATNTGTATVPWQADLSSYVAFPTPFTPGRLYLPTIGTVDVGATGSGNCSIVAVNSATFSLLKAVSGGSCSTSANFANRITFPAGSRTGTFRTINDFTNDGGTANPPGVNCSLSAIVNEAVRPAIIIRTTANCGGTTIPRVATMGGGGGPVLSELIFFLNSCFAEGTAIRRADGSTVPVEKIKSGDKIIADNKGTVLTVSGTSYGAENEPLVELRDNKGHKVQMTASHPLIRASGEVALASSIRKDDRVMTDRGVATVVSVARIPYTGKVYNLKVGTPDERTKVGKDGTTMFAGGFLVGDSSMQQAHTTPKPAVARAPAPEWQRDYQGSRTRTRVLR
jgi:hypothetical protein